MIHFSKNLIYNMCYEVLEQKWLKFSAALRAAKRFEDLLTLHDQFLDDCLRECMLCDSQLLKQISRINDICRIYSNIIQNFTKNIKEPSRVK
jgi:gamma-tubulin complex component 2